MSQSDAKKAQLEVETADGRVLEVECPICKSKQFGNVGPSDLEIGVGFQHVTVGQEKFRGANQVGRMLSMPIKFKVCMNCGYILKFMLKQGEEPWT